MGQRQAYGLGRDSTRHLRRMSCQQHSGHTRCSSSQSSIEQDGQVHQVGQHPHLLSVCHRNSRCVAWDSHRSDAGNWQAHHGCHWGHQGNRVPLLTPVHGFSTGNAVSFQNTLITEWNVVAAIYFVYIVNISACGFVLVGFKIIITIIIIIS